MRLLHVVGARPNFPKLAPVLRSGADAGFKQLVVHTGQHYDDVMSASFFRQLQIPPPDLNLQIGAGSHAQQTARVMERLEPVVVEFRPDWVVTYGDVNSTMAAAITSAKLGVRAAHVEAGLRSRDRAMPEELNRVVADVVCDLLLTPSLDARENLLAEGIPDDRIAFVGNTMIDSLVASLPSARASGARLRLAGGDGAVVVTLHRPSNVDDLGRLAEILRALKTIAKSRKVVFPAHPRTRQRLEGSGVATDGVQLTDPIHYEEMIDLIDSAAAVITDSGGIQEETTFLGVPCLTIRHNTERPVTISQGTNRLVPDPADIPDAFENLRRPDSAPAIAGWDGHAGERVIAALESRSH